MLNARQVEAKRITTDLLEAALTVTEPAGNVARSLQAVVSSKSRGLRELLMIVVVARLMDPTFRASRDYGACSPRGLYPGIREALASAGIPHGKDGALNVAKGNPPIDRQWAGAREDQTGADEVVRMVGALEGMNPDEVRELGAQLCRLLLLEASRVAEMQVEIKPSEDPDWLAIACRELIERAPDRGNTPQTIAGLLLEAKANALCAPIRIDGIGDSACVTTSTSNKLGDLCVLDPDDRPLIAYEVTVKPFGSERVTDCTAAIHDYSVANETPVTEMTVLCRPGDLHPDAKGGDGRSAYLGAVDDQDVRYRFVDLYEWIRLELLGLPPSARAGFHAALSLYVNNPNTAEAVKTEWARINP
ncbi:MAG: hypothetical protein FD171_56 [Actinobacteria bacterium]|nr:MAG: hypothetical protein FD171_56 [Actinomycetota bacterium]